MGKVGDGMITKGQHLEAAGFEDGCKCTMAEMERRGVEIM